MRFLYHQSLGFLDEHYLKFNVSWILDVFFQINSIISKSSCSLTLSLLKVIATKLNRQHSLTRQTYLFFFFFLSFGDHIKTHVEIDRVTEISIFVKKDLLNPFQLSYLQQLNKLIRLFSKTHATASTTCCCLGYIKYFVSSRWMRDKQ